MTYYILNRFIKPFEKPWRRSTVQTHITRRQIKHPTLVQPDPVENKILQKDIINSANTRNFFELWRFWQYLLAFVLIASLTALFFSLRNVLDTTLIVLLYLMPLGMISAVWDLGPASPEDWLHSSRGGVRMVMLSPPCRLLLEPLLEYITGIPRQRQTGETLTIVVPEFVSNSRVTAALHIKTAELLRNQLKPQPGIVIINVPYHVRGKMKAHNIENL